MALKTSTGLRSKMLGTDGLRTIMNLGFIKIYSGTVPATADAALTGATLLCTISNNSTATGITLDPAVPAAGIIGKEPTEVWTGINAASGTATFYRHVAVGDTGALSVLEPRIQGNIATFGAEMNLTSTVLASGATQTLDFYTIAIPTL